MAPQHVLKILFIFHFVHNTVCLDMTDEEKSEKQYPGFSGITITEINKLTYMKSVNQSLDSVDIDM